MTDLLRWSVTVALTAAAGLLLGDLFGEALHRLSWDYIVVPEDYAALGLRQGVFGGTLLGAVQIVGDRPRPSFGRLAGAFLMLGVLALVLLGLGAGIGMGLGRIGLVEPEGWFMPNPQRHMLYLGLDGGVRAGPVVGALVAGWLLWRGRTPRS